MLSRVILLRYTSTLPSLLKIFSQIPKSYKIISKFPSVAWPTRASWFSRCVLSASSPHFFQPKFYLCCGEVLLVLCSLQVPLLSHRMSSPPSQLGQISAHSSIEQAFHLPLWILFWHHRLFAPLWFDHSRLRVIAPLQDSWLTFLSALGDVVWGPAPLSYLHVFRHSLAQRMHILWLVGWMTNCQRLPLSLQCTTTRRCHDLGKIPFIFFLRVLLSLIS